MTSTATGAAPDSARRAHDIATAKLAISITLLLATYAISLMLHYSLSIGRLQLLFLLPVLAITVAFGVWHGCGAAIGAVAALALEPDPLTLDAKQWLTSAIIYLGVAWSSGFYADTIRWRRREAEDGFQGEHHPQVAAASRSFVGSLLHGGNAARRSYVMNQLLAAAATTTLVLLAGAIISRLEPPSLSPLIIFFLLVPVLAGAAMFGMPVALLAAVVATFVHHSLLTVSAPGLDPGVIDALASFFIFAGAGGCVGAYADRARNEHKAIQRLFATGAILSLSGTEDEIWGIVFDATTQVDRHVSVRLTDETGLVRHEVLHRAAPPPSAPETSGSGPTPAGGWRTRRLCVDGRDLGVLSWHSPWVGQEDRATVDHIVGAIADLGASAVMRARLNVEKAEIEFVARTEQLRTLLLDAVSHHFRTPLATILGSVTNLLSPQHDASSDREFLLIIKEQANRLDRYVDNFLGVARLESGSIEIKPQPVDLEPVLYDIWESFGESGGARRFLEVQIDDRPILADPSALKQVLGNILENAIKFSTEDTIVSVEGRVVGANMVFEVSDQGSAIPPADLPRIFGRFYRSREAKVSGLGLGLYISKSLVEMMGGTIEALNRTDGIKGATMRVVLPLAPS